jgi:multidrug resistance efflux pump
MTTSAPAASTDGHRATLLQREVDDLRGKLGQLRAAAKRAASDMERAAVLIGGNYLGTGYAQSLNERADELRAAIARSEA